MVSDEGKAARIRVAAAPDSAAFSARGGRPQVELECLDARQALLEDVMLSFRRSVGLDEALRARALASVPELDAVFTRLVSLGLLEERVDDEGGRHLTSTRRGWLCGNEVFGAVWDLAAH